MSGGYPDFSTKCHQSNLASFMPSEEQTYEHCHNEIQHNLPHKLVFCANNYQHHFPASKMQYQYLYANLMTFQRS